MASAAEGASAKQGIAANLAVGLDTLSGNDVVTFTKYIRLVLPLDGYLFWVRADLVTNSALFNVMGFNRARFNQAQMITAAAPTIQVKGSFHYATEQQQNETETQGVNTVIFTAESPIQEFNEVSPNVLWIGEYAGDDENFDAPITFAFNRRGAYYRKADLFHYTGTAVLPVMRTQLIDNVEELASRALIVSNSLPIWLTLSNYSPFYNDGINNSIQLYPSFLVPENLPPPYGVIHIPPEGTEVLQSAPTYGRTLSQYSLCKDRVKVTLYGCNNDAAMMFLAAVEQYSYDYSYIGMMTPMPSIRDEKMTQSELNVIAQKKTMEFEVSYNQGVARNIARQLITQAIVNFIPEPYVSPVI